MARIVLDTDVASLSYKGRLPMPLATRNLKDFTDFAEHDGLRMIGVS